MMKQLTAVLGVTLCLLAPLHVFAEDDPEKTIREVNKTTSESSFESGSTGVKGAWVDFVRKLPFSNGSYNGGVKQFEGRDIIVASGVAIVSVREGQPGWVESRIAAYDRAELEAKAQVVSFLMSNLEQERVVDLVENANTNDGEVQKKVQEGSALMKKLKSIGNKGLKIIETEMDSYLAKYDENYDPEEFSDLTPKQKKIRFEGIFKRAVGNTVLRTVTGFTPSFTTESRQNQEYAVLVGIVWSPKSNQLAISMANDVYNIPAVTPSKSVDQYVSDLGAKVLSLWGTRLMIDEKGHYNVVAFAQAAPSTASSTRQESALQNAKGIAKTRAEGMISTFVNETVSATEKEDFSETIQEFDDGTQGTEIIRNVIKKRKGKVRNVKLRGLATVTDWSINHPITGQKVAGAVVVWSPSSREMSENMLRKLKEKPSINKSENPSKQISSSPIEGMLEPVIFDTSIF